MLKLFLLSLLIQNSNIIYQDIFFQTKPGIEIQQSTENNPVASLFFQHDLYFEAYLISVLSIWIASELLLIIDDTGILSTFFMGVIWCLEYTCVLQNEKMLNKKHNYYTDFKISIPVYHIYCKNYKCNRYR